MLGPPTGAFDPEATSAVLITSPQSCRSNPQAGTPVRGPAARGHQRQTTRSAQRWAGAARAQEAKRRVAAGSLPFHRTRSMPWRRGLSRSGTGNQYTARTITIQISCVSPMLLPLRDILRSPPWFDPRPPAPDIGTKCLVVVAELIAESWFFVGNDEDVEA